MIYTHSTFRKAILFIVLVLIAPLCLHAGEDTDKEKVTVIIFLDDMTIPLIADKPKPDTTPPHRPHFVIAPPSSTYEDHLYIEIGGEVDASVYINGKYSGRIGQSGTTTLKLDTSGDNGIKHFDIVLRDTSGNRSVALSVSITKETDPKYDIDYKGLTFYSKSMDPSGYKLTQLSDGKFNALTPTQKREVANTLLGTLFFGYPLHILQGKIDKGNFLSQLREELGEDVTDKAWLENYILDESIFSHYNQWSQPQTITILVRFYAMKDLDRYFLNNWIAYILTQTIMFSPAYELTSTHSPDIGNVYNRLVTLLNIDGGMRYTTYVHMMSEENWRRFRSPEDNGREMLEIFLFDTEDSHVPIAAKALQNWKLNAEGDTLEVGLNDNTEPLHLFGTIIVNGDDFYRELVKSSAFTEGVTRRLVDFFFPNATTARKLQITDAIVSSRPETWQDILLQIIFSEEYLLRNRRVRSAEETFFSLAKKLEYLHKKSTFYYLKGALEKMHQASMKYKLGKTERVPLDTFSFAHYHKYIREQVMLRRSNPNMIDNYASWSRQGWSKAFVAFDRFAYNETDVEMSLENFIRYIFNATISRDPTSAELTLFKSHMIYEKDGEKHLYRSFNMFILYSDPEKQESEREERKANIAQIVLDYISRLEETYTQKEVK